MGIYYNSFFIFYNYLLTVVRILTYYQKTNASDSNSTTEDIVFNVNINHDPCFDNTTIITGVAPKLNLTIGLFTLTSISVYAKNALNKTGIFYF